MIIQNVTANCKTCLTRDEQTGILVGDIRINVWLSTSDMGVVPETEGTNQSVEHHNNFREYSDADRRFLRHADNHNDFVITAQGYGLVGTLSVAGSCSEHRIIIENKDLARQFADEIRQDVEKRRPGSELI